MRRVLNSLLCEYLSSASYVFTLSVFQARPERRRPTPPHPPKAPHGTPAQAPPTQPSQPEAGLAGGQALSRSEILRILNLGPGCGAPLAAALESAQRPGPGRDGQRPGGGPQPLAVQLLQALADLHGQRPADDAACQTDGPGDFALQREMAAAEAAWAAAMAAQRTAPGRSLEERMAAFQARSARGV